MPSGTGARTTLGRSAGPWWLSAPAASRPARLGAPFSFRKACWRKRASWAAAWSPAATAGGGAVAVGSTVQVEEELDEITQIDAALAGESGTPQAPPPRGPTFTSEYGGTYSSKTNAAGGEVWTSVGRVNQYDVRDVVNETYRGGNINILTGVHGSATGATAVEDGFLSADELEFYNGTPGIRIYNMPACSTRILLAFFAAQDTTIGAFCNSEACLGAVPMIAGVAHVARLSSGSTCDRQRSRLGRPHPSRFMCRRPSSQVECNVSLAAYLSFKNNCRRFTRRPNPPVSFEPARLFRP